MPTKTIQVAIADDQLLFIEGLESLLSKESNIQMVGRALNGAELVALVREKKPDVVLTDVHMPVMDGIEATRQLRSKFPELNVIALSMFDDIHLMVDMFEAGGKGYLLKNVSRKDAVEAIKTVYQGGLCFPNNIAQKLLAGMAQRKQNGYVAATFSSKEKEVLQLISREYSTKEIAGRVNATSEAVESTRRRMQKKTGTKNVVGLVMYALKRGILQIHEPSATKNCD